MEMPMARVWTASTSLSRALIKAQRVLFKTRPCPNPQIQKRRPQPQDLLPQDPRL